MILYLGREALLCFHREKHILTHSAETVIHNKTLFSSGNNL